MSILPFLFYWIILTLYKRIINCRRCSEFWLFQVRIDVLSWRVWRQKAGRARQRQPAGCPALSYFAVELAWLLYTFRPSGLSFCWECNCQNLLDCFYNGRPELGLAGPWWWKDRELTSYYSGAETTLCQLNYTTPSRHSDIIGVLFFLLKVNMKLQSDNNNCQK